MAVLVVLMAILMMTAKLAVSMMQMTEPRRVAVKRVTTREMTLAPQQTTVTTAHPARTKTSRRQMATMRR